MKKTRIIYTDDAHILTYEALPPNEFKELFMKILTYQQGDEVLPSDFSNPALYAMFAGYKCLIDDNERKWVERSEINKKNRAQREVKKAAELKGNMTIPTCEDLPTEVEKNPTIQPTPSPVTNGIKSTSGITGNYDVDFQKAVSLHESNDWWYDHHLNDMCRKYSIKYEELKQLVEG